MKLPFPKLTNHFSTFLCCLRLYKMKYGQPNTKSNQCEHVPPDRDICQITPEGWRARTGDKLVLRGNALSAPLDSPEHLLGVALKGFGATLPQRRPSSVI